MLRPGNTLPMTAGESAALDKLCASHDGSSISICRNDPGESGPLRVEVAGAGVWLINEEGKAVKQRG